MAINEFQDKKWPKNIIRFTQSLYRHVSDKRVILNNYNLRTLKVGNLESFFGYYDRSPVSEDGKYLLVHVSNRATRLNPSKSHPIYLCLYNLGNDTIEHKWLIQAYNWQQGCKPQWIDNNRFIFNNYDDELMTYYSVIVNLQNMSTKRIEMPSYESCPKYSLSLNFSRLSKLRPDYGYRNISKFPLCDDIDGIFYYSFEHNHERLLVSIAELRKFNPVPSMKDANHKVNHIIISPDLTKFMFMHRWINNGVKMDRLYIYNFATESLDCIADNGMVSHCFWLGNEKIIGYMNGPDKKPGYYIINLMDKTLTRMSEKIQQFGDGHPHCLRNQVLFDTYPDSTRMKHLYLFDIENEELQEVGSFYEPLGYENQCRCDLHPRIISDKLFSVDSTHSGRRDLILLEKSY